MTDITIKIGGPAGYGIMTTGIFVGKIATRSGYHAFEYPEYPSLIRGGHNVVEIRISDEKVFSQGKLVDILVCLNKETYDLHKDEVKKSGMVVADKDEIDILPKIINKGISFVHVSFGKIVKEQKLNQVMVNNIALGALVYLLGADIKILDSLIAESFAKKSEEIIEKNIEAARLGFEEARKSCRSGYQKKIPKKTKIVPKIYLTGNEIIGLGTIAAGCKFFAAYPMTPASTLLHYLASKAESVGMVVKHAEDEIAVVNMAIGASWAGARSMIGTSGGGFALMVEAVSLAGMTEVPLVVMMGQRPGPATGMPTWTEQGDLLFILHAGHGEFPKIILAPGDAEEAYKLTIEAFNLADKYQTPVFILTDKYLLEGHQSVDKLKIENAQRSPESKIDRGKLLSQKELNSINNYQRYKATSDGISPRAIPGQKNGLHQANSYEHLEDGHTTEEEKERIKQVEKRNRKRETFLKSNAQLPVLFGRKEAPQTVVSWGSMKGPILQAMKGNEEKFNYLHFSYLWPLPEENLKELLQNFKSTLLVENNSTAQLGQLIRMVTGIEIKNKLLKYSGRPLYPEEVLEKVR